jgi:hypothetical protein
MRWRGAGDLDHRVARSLRNPQDGPGGLERVRHLSTQETNGPQPPQRRITPVGAPQALREEEGSLAGTLDL